MIDIDYIRKLLEACAIAERNQLRGVDGADPHDLFVARLNAESMLDRMARTALPDLIAEVDIARRFQKLNDPFGCSFCGKARNQVKKIISGPRAFICDECVDLSAEILQSEIGERRAVFDAAVTFVDAEHTGDANCAAGDCDSCPARPAEQALIKAVDAARKGRT